MTTSANTPTHYYIDNADVKRLCDKNFKTIDKECGPKESRGKEQHPVLNKLLGPANTKKLEDISARVKNKLPATAENAWMSHCDGLWIKPASVTSELEEFNKMFQSMSNDLGQALNNVVNPILNELEKAAEIEAKNFAENQWEKAAVRELIEIGVGGGPEDPIGDVVALADRAYTWYSVATFAPTVLNKLKDLASFKDLATKAMGEMSGLASNAKNLTPTQLMSGGMGVLGRLNACTRARRCLLVPYKKTGTMRSLNGEGCCPGQSGHHILPDEMTKDGNCPGDGGYKPGDAPTVCVEGTNNAMGTHGQIHDVLVGQMKNYRNGFFGSDTMDYETARNKGIVSVMKTFPESNCNRKCLAAQLDAYYKKKCTKQLPAVAGKKEKSESGGDVD